MWPTGTGRNQLLFIFPTTVNLTTITVHYYSSSDLGLPELKFWAVPNDFDIWEALTASYRVVFITAIPSGNEPAGHSKVSVSVNFYTKKVLLSKMNSDYQFAMSEVEFYNCSGKLLS